MSRHDENLLCRAVELEVGELTASKRRGLRWLRERYIKACNRFVSKVFVKEPLKGVPLAKEMDARLNKAQKGVKGLNKAYAEKAKMAAKEAVMRGHGRYLCKILGRLYHCTSLISGASDGERRYYYVPQEIQDSIEEGELAQLARYRKKQGLNKTLEMLQSVLFKHKPCGLSPNQIAVLREIYRQVHSRYSKPLFGEDPSFVAQIHLDYRLVRGDYQDVLACFDAGARMLMDSDNERYKTFLEVSNPTPNGPAIRLPLVIHRPTLERLMAHKREGQSEPVPQVRSLILEIGQGCVSLRMVLAKQPPEVPGINDCEHLIGRDFGYANTITLSVVERDREIEEEELERISSMDKEQAFQFLSTHAHPADNIKAQLRFSGRPFMALIDKHASKIDRLKQQIDRHFNKIERLKAVLSAFAGKKGLIDPKGMPQDALARRVHEKFFSLLSHVKHLKGIRGRLFAKIRSIKRCWFGYLSNCEVALAKAYKAAIIAEDLTIAPIACDRPDYKGRTFNRMLAHGARGLYQKVAAQKCAWNGIPCFTLPSYYTSSTCPIHARVHKSMRKAERFRCPQCNQDRHADQNAADTLALYLLMRPLTHVISTVHGHRPSCEPVDPGSPHQFS